MIDRRTWVIFIFFLTQIEVGGYLGVVEGPIFKSTIVERACDADCADGI